MQTLLNQLGSSRTPLLFILPFEKPFDQGALWPLCDLSAEISVQMGPYRLGAQPLAAQTPPTIALAPPQPESYRAAFEALQNEIHAGNTYLANLCAITPIVNHPDLEALYAAATSRHKLLWRDRFVSFSPESFITIKGNQITTHPMKGTLSAHEDPDILLNDLKELAEHTMVVDLLRNDLARVAKGVRVTRWRYLERAGDLWQSSSAIRGWLEPHWPDRLGDLLYELLPAGSISGTPKRSTTKILGQIEGFKRGFFSGVAGIFDGQNLYSMVLIRFVERTAGGLVFKSGGGITCESRWQNEFAELRAKAALPLGPPPKPEPLIETLRIQNGRILHPAWHQRRIAHAQSRRQIPARQIPTLPPVPTKGTWRLRLTYGQSRPQAEILPLTSRPPGTLRLVCAQIAYPLKLSDRCELLRLHESGQNADDVLIVRSGLITDTTVANVAFFDGDRWLTPAAPLLKGTVRARLLSGGFLKPASLKAEGLDRRWLVAVMNALIGFCVLGRVEDVICK